MTKHWMLVVLLAVTAIRPVIAESDSDKKERTLTIQGQGKASAVPDTAVLSVEVNHEGTALDPILAQVRKDMNKVLEVVKAQGIAEKDIQTELFQVRPKYEQDRRSNPQRVGYVVANRVSVKVRDLKKTGKVLSSVLEAGATTVDGPNFVLDNRLAAELEALAAASQDAKIKAEAVAKSVGVQLGSVQSINPQNVNWPAPYQPMYRQRGMAMAAEAQEPIAAGEQTLIAYVSVTYSIR